MGKKEYEIESTMFGGYSKKAADEYIHKLHIIIRDMQNDMDKMQDQKEKLMHNHAEAEKCYQELWEKGEEQEETIETQKAILETHEATIESMRKELAASDIALKDLRETISSNEKAVKEKSQRAQKSSEHKAGRRTQKNEADWKSKWNSIKEILGGSRN